MENADSEEIQNIIVVDDDLENRNIIKKMFQESYSILEGCNGLEGLNLIQQHKDRIAVVVLDVNMPIMTGYDVMTEMKKYDFLDMVPVVLITGDTDLSILEWGYRLGAADVIKKPLLISSARQRIANVIELYRHKKHLEKLVQQQTLELQRQNDALRLQNEVMMGLLYDIITYRSTESQNHLQCVEQYANVLAKCYRKLYPRSKMTVKKIEQITKAARFHDLGKITMPELLMKRQGRLLPAEMEYLKEHTIRGSEIVKSMSEFQNQDFIRITYNVCRYHHERYDGTGYPCGLKGEQIPIEAQIVSVADMFDALVNVTAHKDAIPGHKAVSMLLSGACGILSPRMQECLNEAKEELCRLSKEETIV